MTEARRSAALSGRTDGPGVVSGSPGRGVKALSRWLVMLLQPRARLISSRVARRYPAASDWVLEAAHDDVLDLVRREALQAIRVAGINIPGLNGVD